MALRSRLEDIVEGVDGKWVDENGEGVDVKVGVVRDVVVQGEKECAVAFSRAVTLLAARLCVERGESSKGITKSHMEEAVRIAESNLRRVEVMLSEMDSSRDEIEDETGGSGSCGDGEVRDVCDGLIGEVDEGKFGKRPEFGAMLLRRDDVDDIHPDLCLYPTK